ncbi:hypothetical protein CTI14_54560, partial [Methylobacterium radiotolerans]
VLPSGDISRSSRRVKACLLETPLLFPTLNDEDLHGRQHWGATRRGFQKRQRQVFRWLNQVVITELLRRNGPDQLYKVTTSKVLPSGDISRSSRRVKACLLETPLLFPTLNDEDL